MRTIENIRQFITSEFRPGSGAEIADTDQLIEEGIIDSFGIMALLGFLEERYAVRVDGDELMPENFATVKAISALVERKTGLSGVV